MDSESGKMTSDVLIKDLGGCGPFQVVFSILPYLSHIPWAFSTLFMSFGSHSTGWRCLDARTKKDSFYMHTKLDLIKYQLTEENMTHLIDTLPDYITDSCRGFQWCDNLDFDPKESTIVTEFGLECNKSWMISLIITLQMAGGIAGGMFLGCFGDLFGRKLALYSILLSHCVLNVACMFSVNVEMFIALRFFVGACDILLGRLPIAYVEEAVPPRWRMVGGSIPVWTIGSTLFAISAMMTKDWFQMMMVIAILSFVCFLPVFWMPESLRWLAVKGKTESLLKAGEKIAVMNRTKLDHAECKALIMETSNEENEIKKYGILNLFTRGYASYALILGFAIMCADIVYFSAHFGASILPGNFYVNLILLSVTELPANAIAMFLPNIVGRKHTITIAMMFQAFCLFGAVAVEVVFNRDPHDYSVVVLVLLGKLGTAVGRIVLSVYILELYPTVVRCTASGYSGVMGMIGAMIAPFVVAREKHEIYICFLLMSVVGTICSCLVLLVPETKGKPLVDTWEDDKKKKKEEKEEEKKDEEGSGNGGKVEEGGKSHGDEVREVEEACRETAMN